ncbi:MAG: hypothetical protein AAGF24_06790 [Cyanobacteria bacterium P01_H01_bin.121]
MLPGELLEAYSRQHPDEVLLVQVEQTGARDEVMVFRGFSSSLSQATAFNPDVPVIQAGARILGIDRLRGPYNPDKPEYLQQGMTWETFHAEFCLDL